MSDAIYRVCGRKIIRRTQPQPFNRIVAEMFVEPRSPGGTHAVARLQNRLQPRAKPTTHKAEMAAMAARHQFEDSVRLPVTLDPEHYAFIGPLHAESRP